MKDQLFIDSAYVAEASGEMFDVILSNARTKTLASYPVILLVGDHEFDSLFVSNLFEALRRGSRLLMNKRHANQLGDDFERLQGTGDVEVLEEWINPKKKTSSNIKFTPRPAAKHPVTC